MLYHFRYRMCYIYSFHSYLNILIKENWISQKLFYLCRDNFFDIILYIRQKYIFPNLFLISGNIFSVMYEVTNLRDLVSSFCLKQLVSSEKVS